MRAGSSLMMPCTPMDHSAAACAGSLTVQTCSTVPLPRTARARPAIGTGRPCQRGGMHSACTWRGAARRRSSAAGSGSYSIETLGDGRVLRLSGEPKVAATLGASLSFRLPAAGTYYLSIDGVGVNNPANSGYSDYGSLGQYAVAVTVYTPGSLPPAAVISSTTACAPSRTPSVGSKSSFIDSRVAPG